MVMPPCIGVNGLNVLKAFVWWGVSYNSGSSTTPTLTVTNPIGGVFNYTATLVGTSGPKCWGEIGTRTFRADVTTSINTSGNYAINIAGNPVGEVDGATFVIVYRDQSVTYQGTMIINDGCQTFASGTPSTMSVANFTACANSINGSGFSVTGDQQNNISPPTHQTTINGTTQTFNNKFWNTDIVNTNVTSGQTSVSFTNTPSPSDCWSYNVIAYYFQTSSCISCFTGITASVTSQNAYCSNNGWATVSVSGGNAPYTYAWNTSPPQNGVTATGLGAGTYTCTVYDAGSCNTSIVTAIITQPTTLTAPSSASNVSCAGGSNGSTSVTAIGGTPGYTYSWSPSGGNGATASNLAAGTYTVTVTDSHGCTITSTAVVAANPNPTVNSSVTTSYCPLSNQTIITTFTSSSYVDVAVCSSNPSGYVTDNQTCTDPNNADCAGHFRKDSLVAPYSTMGANLSAASVQSVYVSMDTVGGNNSRGCGDDNRLWLRSPAGTLFLLAAQKTSNNTATNHYKPTFTVAGPLGILPNTVGSYNSVGYQPDQSALSSAPWIGEVPGATWAGNANENYSHAPGQWMVYTNDQVGGSGCNPGGNYTKITEFCMTFRTYPPPTYAWSTSISSSSGCNTYLSSTSIANPSLFDTIAGNYNCIYNLVMTDAMGCTATTSVNINCDILPISLLSYSGKNTAFGNELEWSTASEINNSYFTIERSTDGQNYAELKRVPTEAINGNSSSILNYSLTDAEIKPGIYYYRLKQTDIDGHFEIEGTIAIQVKSDVDIFNISPNPAHNVFNIVFNEDLSIQNVVLKIFDVMGRNVHEQPLNSKLQTLSPKLSAGVYFVKLSDGVKVYEQKLVIE
jgi:hypothetical protein